MHYMHSMQVAAHHVLPRSAGLYAQGILMSGNDDSLPLDAALGEGARFAARDAGQAVENGHLGRAAARHHGLLRG